MATNGGGCDMFAYIYRLIDQFERQHGIEPNLLYLNELHFKELKEAVDEDQLAYSITNLLRMELVISREITHPHVAWTQTAQRIAV
jgi:hypothetical protein